MRVWLVIAVVVLLGVALVMAGEGCSKPESAMMSDESMMMDEGTIDDMSTMDEGMMDEGMMEEGSVAAEAEDMTDAAVDESTIDEAMDVVEDDDILVSMEEYEAMSQEE